MKTRYTVLHDPLVPRFPWRVVNADGHPALWNPMQKSGACRCGFALRR